MRQFWAMLFLMMMTATSSVGQVEATPSPEPLDAKSGHFKMAQTLSYNSYYQKLPDAPSSTRPLMDQEKFRVFVQDARSPLAFFTASMTAGYYTTNNRVYGGGWNGYGKNYATAVAEHQTTSFFGRYLFPTLLSQDPRYHPSEKEGFWKRSTYAASRVLVTRNDAGQKTLNSSYLLGALVSTAIASCYRPVHRTTGQTLMDFGTNVGTDAGINIVKEFWPKIRTLTPRRLRRIEDRMVGYQGPVGLVDVNQR